MKTKNKKQNVPVAGIAELLKHRNPAQTAAVRKKMELAEKIYRGLTAKGLRQKDLADSLGKKQSEISKWLSGTHNFTVDTLLDIEKVTGLNLINTTRDASTENLHDLESMTPTVLTVADKHRTMVYKAKGDSASSSRPRASRTPSKLA